MFFGVWRGQLAGLVVCLIALAVAAAGCGEDSSKAEPLSKSAFIQQADAICANATKERNQASKELPEGGGGSSDEAAAGIETLVSPITVMAEELGELTPPKGDEQQVEEIVDAFEAGVGELEEDPASPEAASAFAKANEEAENYGLSCSV